MADLISEQNILMEKIIRDYGALIRGAVSRAIRGRPGSEDVESEVHFAVLLTVRKFGTGWNPPKSFILAVVRNKVNDFLRQKYREMKRIAEVEKQLRTQVALREEVISKVHGLTASEFRVFRLLGMGMTNSEMAEALHISLYTIRSHMKKIHAKCGVKDRSKLTLIAHLVCYREKTETRGKESEYGEQPGPWSRSAGGPADGAEPELWEPAPSPVPALVKTETEYLS